MTRPAGGVAVGAASARARLAYYVFAKASARGITPNCSPFTPINRTPRARIRSLIRTPRSIDLHASFRRKEGWRYAIPSGFVPEPLTLSAATAFRRRPKVRSRWLLLGG